MVLFQRPNTHDNGTMDRPFLVRQPHQYFSQVPGNTSHKVDLKSAWVGIWLETCLQPRLDSHLDSQNQLFGSYYRALRQDFHHNTEVCTNVPCENTLYSATITQDNSVCSPRELVRHFPNGNKLNNWLPKSHNFVRPERCFNYISSNGI